MRLRSDTRVLTGALLASLGIVPQACGGQSVTTADDDGASSDGGSDGSGGAGNAPNGGSRPTGGVSGTSPTGGGGTAPTGGTGAVPAGGVGAGPAGGVGGSPIPENRYPCENPVEIGAGTSGFVRCESGVKRRRSIETCYVGLPRPDPLPEVIGATCSSDLECQDLPYGFCGEASSAELASRYCMQGCATDADCGGSLICECGDFVGTCVSASCRSDADCIQGFYCQTHDRLPGCSDQAYACQSPNDSCATDADCSAAQTCSAGNDGDQPRSCTLRSCVPGRPFFVDGELRTAKQMARADWALGRSWPEAKALSRETRERIGRHYAECAALEHASVASFARFTLGLLAVGAPAELVAESARAMGDEVEHARVAYDLASHFLGRSVGPGALDVSSALASPVTIEELALSTFSEGCLDETLGALEAREAALHAEHPALRSALHRIADEETRHAELAFRFVAWALEHSGQSLAERIARAFESARDRSLAGATDGTAPRGLKAHGVLPAAHRRAIRALGYLEVVAPSVAALLGLSKRSPAEATLMGRTPSA